MRLEVGHLCADTSLKAAVSRRVSGALTTRFEDHRCLRASTVLPRTMFWSGLPFLPWIRSSTPPRPVVPERRRLFAGLARRPRVVVIVSFADDRLPRLPRPHPLERPPSSRATILAAHHTPRPEVFGQGPSFTHAAGLTDAWSATGVSLVLEHVLHLHPRLTLRPRRQPRCLSRARKNAARIGAVTPTPPAGRGTTCPPQTTAASLVRFTAAHGLGFKLLKGAVLLLHRVHVRGDVVGRGLVASVCL